MAFHRIAIVNRGEPAMRVINAVAEYRAETGLDLATIALYTDPDRAAMFVREADESHGLGPAFTTDGEGRRRGAYLDYGLLETALRATNADAVWVGWGFVAEHAEFVSQCEDLGLTFIGPSSNVMRLLGDKISSKRIAEEAGVPVAPWSGGPVVSADAALESAQALGFPVMLKATAGGGGRGIRRVNAADELRDAYESATAEALGAFGDGTLFVESLVEGARHIEVQIVGDRHGTVWPIGVRDCSVQRRNQKIIEEAPSPVLDHDQDRDIKAAAARLGSTAGYTGAGTVEFLYDEDSRQFSFMEVNARLQVEHPITEVTTGTDLVKLQLHVAAGGELEGDAPATIGHAVEARINAEDPDQGFAPAPGRIEILRMPAGPGIRVDSGVEAGDLIAAEFDSMVAKVIASGTDRAEALSRLDRALSQMRVVIQDGASNKAFVQQLLHHRDFQDNTLDIGWVDRLDLHATERASPNAAVALVASAIAAFEELQTLELAAFKASSARGRPEVRGGVGQKVELRYRGQRYSLVVGQLGPDRYRVVMDGTTVETRLDPLGQTESRLTIGDKSWRVLSVVHRGMYSVDVDGRLFRIAHDEGGVVRAPSPAMIVSIEVEPGDVVSRGDRLAVIEAMKSETTIIAEFAGTVRQVDVHENTQVGTGAQLMVIDPDEGDDEQGVIGDRIDLRLVSPPTSKEHGRCVHYLDDLRRLILGWDITIDRLESYGIGATSLCPDPLDESEVRRLEYECLSSFVDIISLFRREPALDEDRRSTEEYLFVYLRDLTAKGAGLPQRFVDQLLRALSHYGVDSLEPTPDLDEALLRIARSHARMDANVKLVLVVLEDRMNRVIGEEGGRFDELLNRIIIETQRRYQAVSDIAREARYYAFDEPFLQEVEQEAYREATEHVDYLESHPDAADKAERVAALVACPQPLKPMLSQRFVITTPEVRPVLLEVMTRRYYRIRDLGPFTTSTIDGFGFAASVYLHDGRAITVISTHVDLEQLAEACRAAQTLLNRLTTTDDVVLDVYPWNPGRDTTPEQTCEYVRGVLSSELGSLELRRIVVAISSPETGRSIAGVLNFTFRPTGDGGYREQAEYRDMHPMMAKRLELWRLGNFHLERIPSLEDLYIFRAVAKDSQRDERLFALGEVRDMTPQRDETGRLIRLPELERTFHELLGAIRRFQAHRPPDRRLQWNRVMMYVWPELTLRRREINEVIERLAPETVGLGVQRVSLRVRMRNKEGTTRIRMLEIGNPSGRNIRVRFRKPSTKPIKSLDPYRQKVARLRQRGMMHPHELVSIMAPAEDSVSSFPPGDFVEYDLGPDGLQPVDRPPGANTANVVVGLVTNYTDKHPDGMTRVAILGDPSQGMGNLAEPECSRILAALELARNRSLPVEWFAVSAGALISRDSGTENMDWIARVLRHLVEFTQAGGQVNVIVAGVNVGAQPYWNAEATMLMHTKGILVMTPESSMVLTGKQALDYSGGVSAEDNEGIGGYERIMGPSGQAQYFARDLPDACRILLAHYDHAYVVPGERFPRAWPTSDPVDRNVEHSPHGGELETIGAVFSEETNPGRKQPFEMRQVMAAAIDQDRPPLERWFGMQDAEIAIVWDAHLGGQPVTLIGFESKQLTRLGAVPADGPTQWTSGTLFPRSSKKVARAINAASGNRPLVILANLSGFDGSPESMRTWQLEYGAEIGRAVVNFRGPVVFCVVSRYHGGAFVVFSKALNDNMEVAALIGSKASVIGGAPAAAVVFAREVEKRTEADPRVVEIKHRRDGAAAGDRTKWTGRLIEIREIVRAEKRGEIADEFDRIHSIERAQHIGSVDRIVRPSELRPYLVDAVQRGMARELHRLDRSR